MLSSSPALLPYDGGLLGAEVYNEQVGGHSTFFLIDENKKLAKPLNPHEGEVYQALINTPLERFTPKFYGVATDNNVGGESTTRSFQKSGDFLVLENLAFPYKRPNIMDIKMGINFHETTHSVDGIQKRQVKCLATSMAELHFRVYSMRKFDYDKQAFFTPSENEYRVLNNHDNSLQRILRYYVSLERMGASGHLALAYADQLDGLAKAIETTEVNISFFSSSVLLIHESAWGAPLRPSVWLIDFDKTVFETDPGMRDRVGCVRGIKNLAYLLREIGNAVISVSRDSPVPTGLMKAPLLCPERGRRRTKSDPLVLMTRDRVKGVVPTKLGENRSIKSLVKDLF